MHEVSTLLFLVVTSAFIGTLISSHKPQSSRHNTSIQDESVHSDVLSLRGKRQAFRDRHYPLSIWIDGPIPFTLDRALSLHARSIVMKSVRFWQDNTCIDFAFNGRGKNSIAFIKGRGCYSSIGRIWRARSQALSVGSECEHFHTVTHELAHALGLFHTQSRSDRNRYVNIVAGNALTSQRSNFFAESPRISENYGLPYEYGSVMHYRNHEFSWNRYPTVVPKDPLHEKTMGSGTGPSFLDVLLVNKHYNCLERCSRYKTKCTNGGYPHPRQCNQCACPSGFGGRFCETKEYSRGCGGTVFATQKLASLSWNTGQYGKRDDMSYCHWWIQSQQNRPIEVRITSLNAPCWEGCLFGGVEIKAAYDKRLTGYRFCCRKSVGKYIIASGGILPVILFNRQGFTSFQIEYRAVFQSDGSRSEHKSAETWKDRNHRVSSGALTAIRSLPRSSSSVKRFDSKFKKAVRRIARLSNRTHRRSSRFQQKRRPQASKRLVTSRNAQVFRTQRSPRSLLQ